MCNSVYARARARASSKIGFLQFVQVNFSHRKIHYISENMFFHQRTNFSVAFLRFDEWMWFVEWYTRAPGNMHDKILSCMNLCMRVS